MTNLIYLASPLSNPERKVREERYNLAIEATGLLLKMGVFVYSPIAHNYVIANRHELPNEFSFWQEFDSLMISRCDVLAVLMLPGWRESVGVIYEINLALELGKTVKYIKLDELRYAEPYKIRMMLHKEIV